MVPLASRNALKAMVTTINTNAQTAENIAEQFSKLPATADTEAEKAQAAGAAAAYNALSDAQNLFSATLKARIRACSPKIPPPTPATAAPPAATTACRRSTCPRRCTPHLFLPTPPSSIIRICSCAWWTANPRCSTRKSAPSLQLDIGEKRSSHIGWCGVEQQ